MSALVPDLIVKPTPAPLPVFEGPRPIVGLTRPELGQALTEAGVPARQIRMRTTQVWRWVYGRGSRDFAAMTDLAKDFRAFAAERFLIDRPAIVAESHSSDGTIKWLLRFAGGAEAETVYIPDADRGTLCLSSQVGCTLTCSFCHTGTQRWVRNLTAGEIVGQIMLAKDRLDEWDMTRADGSRAITNVVMMGMGEPLYNFDHVKAALAIASDNEGLSLSKRRITLSTAGVVPMMARAGEEIGTMLAISLHAVEDKLRDTLVPLNRRYPIGALMEACRTYPGVSNAKRITFEYVMLDGVNDSPAEARALVRLIDGVPAKINLIPFNPWPGSPYRCSSWEAIERFADILFDAGYASPVRTPRGRDIMAACGQLKSATEKARASEIRRSAAQTAAIDHLPR